MYGTQTDVLYKSPYTTFENDVKMYGTQTIPLQPNIDQGFENDVKMYGTQTTGKLWMQRQGLRMM